VKKQKNADRLLRQSITRAGRRLYSLGHIAAGDGNISARTAGGLILATPSGACKGFMKAKDIVLLAPDGKKISGAGSTSSEIALHLFIYKMRPDIKAVVHAHPPIATGYAAAGIPLDKPILAEAVISLGRVPLAPYATTGTQEVPRSIAKFVKTHDAVLLANHGAVAYGPTMENALWKMETLEHYAKILLVTEILGKQKLLNKSEISRLRKLR